MGVSEISNDFSKLSSRIISKFSSNLRRFQMIDWKSPRRNVILRKLPEERKRWHKISAQNCSLDLDNISREHCRDKTVDWTETDAKTSKKLDEKKKFRRKWGRVTVKFEITLNKVNIMINSRRRKKQTKAFRLSSME